MSVRRNALLSYVATSLRWLSYPFTYLYHSLIPSTINGKNVKNKMKITKIYGNSEVSNQIVPSGDFSDTSTWTTWAMGYSVSSGVATCLATAQYGFLGSNINLVSGHKYILKLKVKLPSANYNAKVGLGDNGYFLNEGVSKDLSTIGNTNWNDIIVYGTYTTNPNATYKRIIIMDLNTSGWANIQVSEVNVIDLTQAYPFDTPTALTDKRVQNILNNGYEGFNSGEIKSTNIGEFETEPYNLFDGELESGYINASGNKASSNSNFVSKNYINVVGGQSYTLELGTITGLNDVRVAEYDSNHNFIKKLDTTSFPIQITLSNETDYILFSGNVAVPQSNRICLHFTGTRTGYATHTSPQTLSFVYQGGGVGTAKNTLEKTATEWVFTRKVVDFDLGSITDWYYDTSLSWATNKIKNFTADNSQAQTILCEKYTSIRFNGYASSSDNNLISFRDNGYTYVKNGSSSTQPSGKVEYELATPQTITIPKKHLACVDLGSLTYGYSSAYGFYSWSLQNICKNATSNAVKANILTGKYLTNTYNQVYSGTTNKNIAFSDSGALIISDNSYTNATDFKNAMQGKYLYYETANEVADIDLTMNIESGGTFTSDSEVLPNVDTEFNSGTLPPEPEVYDITVSGTNGTYTGATSITENSTASVTISADTCYELPSSITVTNASYTYDSDTGLIVLSNPTGNVSITFVCTAEPVSFDYTVTATCTNGTITAPEGINTGESITITITPSAGYGTPTSSSSITVTNATKGTYNASAGTLVISSPTGNVSVSVDCPQLITVNFNITNGYVSSPYFTVTNNTAQIKSDNITATFYIIGNNGYKPDRNLTVSTTSGSLQKSIYVEHPDGGGNTNSTVTGIDCNFAYTDQPSNNVTVSCTMVEATNLRGRSFTINSLLDSAEGWFGISWTAYMGETLVLPTGTYNSNSVTYNAFSTSGTSGSKGSTTEPYHMEYVDTTQSPIVTLSAGEATLSSVLGRYNIAWNNTAYNTITFSNDVDIYNPRVELWLERNAGYEVELDGNYGDSERVYVQINDDPTWYYAEMDIGIGFTVAYSNIPNVYQKTNYVSIAIPCVNKIKIGTSGDPTSYRGPKYINNISSGDFTNLSFSSTGSSSPAYSTSEVTMTQDSKVEFYGND